MSDTPFDSIEGAHYYLGLLLEQVRDVRGTTRADIALAAAGDQTRHRDALRLVEYKLSQLEDHLTAGSRLLNDLRVLRRLLLGERDGPGVAHR